MNEAQKYEIKKLSQDNDDVDRLLKEAGERLGKTPSQADIEEIKAIVDGADAIAASQAEILAQLPDLANMSDDQFRNELASQMLFNRIKAVKDGSSQK